MALLLLLVSLANSLAWSQDNPGYDPGDTPPKLLKQTKPKYPDKAFKAGIQGIVRLEIVIGETGLVEKATVLKSIPALDEAAIQAVHKWRFSPARKDGRAVRTVANAPVAFCIDDKGCKALWEREGGRK